MEAYEDVCKNDFILDIRIEEHKHVSYMKSPNLDFRVVFNSCRPILLKRLVSGVSALDFSDHPPPDHLTIKHQWIHEATKA